MSLQSSQEWKGVRFACVWRAYKDYTCSSNRSLEHLVCSIVCRFFLKITTNWLICRDDNSQKVKYQFETAIRYAYSTICFLHIHSQTNTHTFAADAHGPGKASWFLHEDGSAASWSLASVSGNCFQGTRSASWYGPSVNLSLDSLWIYPQSWWRFEVTNQIGNCKCVQSEFRWISLALTFPCAKMYIIV